MTALHLVASLVATVLATGCSGRSAPGASGGTGSAGLTGGGGADDRCASVRPKVAALYRAEATEREPKRVDEATSDNTTMVMNDCAKAPDAVATCVAQITTIAELEARCMIPLADDGTERSAER